MLGRTKALSMNGFALALLACAVGCSSAHSSDDKRGLGAGAKGGGSGSGATGGTGEAINVNGGGADGTDVGSGGGSATGSGATGGGPSIDVTQGAAGEAGNAGNSDGGTIPGCVPTPEVCDGIDNDCNGIIDDVDVGHDGVCDCLNIGTIGEIGPWSNGGDVFASWLNARSPQGAVALDDQVLTPELLAPLEIIVALHVDTTDVSSNGVTAHAHHAFSDDEVSAFDSWVKKGGGAMSTIGYTSDEADEVTNVNRLLSPLGMAYSNTKLDLDGFITTWVPHPVTMGISSINIENGVEPDGPNGTTLATDSGGRVALQVTQASNGRVLVWGDEWITYDSEWADVKGQQVELFWLNILKWLSPPKTCQVPIPPDVVK
jgi:hypothetical protein